MPLMVPGLRAGHYLCFFGMHVLTPAVLDILGRDIEQADDPRQVSLSQSIGRAGQPRAPPGL